MRLLFACIFTFSFSLTTTAQYNIDSLHHIISVQKSDTHYIKALATLADVYRGRKPDSAILYANKVLAAGMQPSHTKFRAIAYNAIGYANYINGDYNAALQNFTKYYQESESINDKVAMGFAINNQGNVYVEQGDYVAALNKYKQALSIRTSSKDLKGIAMSLNNIGYIYKEIGDYERAVSQFLQALRLHEKNGDKISMSASYNFLGAVYRRKKDFRNSIANQQKALQLQQAMKDSMGMGISYQSIAAAYGEMNDYKKAMENFREALAIYKQNNDIRQIALVASDIGELYYRVHSYDSSLAYFTSSIQLNQRINNRRSMATIWLGAAECLLALNNLPQARAYIDSAVAIITTTNKKEDKKSLFLVQSKYADKTGDSKKALEYYVLYSAQKDSLFTEENVKAIANEQVKYETEKKEQEIALQKAELNNRKIVLIALVFIFLLTILLAFSLYRRYRLKQKAKFQSEILYQQELATKAVIEAEENERKRIAGDLHDGVGQLMTAAKMNLSAIEKEIAFSSEQQKSSYSKVMALVDESCREVRMVSHNMMPNALLKAGLASAVREFIDKIDSRVIKVDLYTEGLNERIDSNVETVLYRVIQECVNNVIKHAGANHLDISLIRDYDGISATVEDNGKGFNTDDRTKFEGIGLKNMAARIQYLKGTVDFDSAIGRGTVVALHVPLA